MLTFCAAARSETSTKTVVQTRGFTIIVDEPPDLGGQNEGANPVEYVLAALAGCLSVVGHVVAKEMGFGLRGLTFELEGDLDPTRFLGGPAGARAGYQEVRVMIRPDADASEAVLQEWLERVKGRCPVSDNIANATAVAVSLGR
jgi:uncharacterized OsmC-like protein